MLSRQLKDSKIVRHRERPKREKKSPAQQKAATRTIQKPEKSPAISQDAEPIEQEEISFKNDPNTRVPHVST